MRATYKSTVGPPLTITFVGDLDLASEDVFREVAAEFDASPGADLVLDIGGVPFIDSSCLAAFITLMRSAQSRGGKFSIVNPTPRALKALTITGLDQMFTIVNQAGPVVLPVE